MDFDTTLYFFRDTLTQLGLDSFRLYLIALTLVILFTFSLREVFRYFSGVSQLAERLNSLENQIAELQKTDKKKLIEPQIQKAEFAAREFLIRN